MAKEMYANFKKAAQEFPGANVSFPAGEPLPNVPGAVRIGPSAPDLEIAEKQIRQNMNINSIISIGMGVIPDGHIVKHGKTENGVNTKVSFENSDGRKLPEIGYFYVFI
jgi:hypothetical protein